MTTTATTGQTASPDAPAADASEDRLPHRPGLDGVRGLAVTAVLLFHGGVPWAAAGWLGVDAFLVLSGFLITTLLLGEHARTGGWRSAPSGRAAPVASCQPCSS
jgi:peptidoglycan/LPS O-acetylase OafA/YrhL